MPKFQVESNGYGQSEIEAESAEDAVRDFLSYHDVELQDHDKTSDPHGVYRDGSRCWQHFTISVSPPHWPCSNSECDELVETEGADCGSCTFECEECGGVFDNSMESKQREWTCVPCTTPLIQLARTAEDEAA